ncbi:centromere kinetochore component CENP-T-domain-containing protein [Daldinia bambusicola]|nr:centromere kinetochore component CENP-T-domain-containing protein [Daldinia bambusicola]
MADPTPNKNRLAAISTPRALATPNRRAISAEPSSLRLSASGRRNPTTPHARAAIRAIDQRRAALFTPGRVGRRRSVARERERETPRDLLRNLSRVLAPTSTVVSSSSSSSPHRGNESTLQTLLEEGDDDDDFPIERPRFSLPLDRDDDDDSELKPPRSSILDDENYTVQSIELPRRAWTEAPLGRLDRSSLGSVRMSDFAGPEIGDDVDDNNVGIDSGFFPPPALDDDTGGIGLDEEAIFERMDEETRRQTMGGQDDFGPIEIPDLGNESTFVMAPVESPTRDPTMAEGADSSDIPGFDPYDDDGDDDGDGDGLGDLTEAPGLDDVDDVDDTEALQDTMISQVANHPAQRSAGRRKPGKRISRHGIEYPSLPVGVVKRLATTLATTAGVSKAKLSSDTVDAIMQATDWYFEQLGDDLSAYARHAGRKTIDESDMMMLMRRQRQTSASTTPFSLAQRYLPRELLQEMRMSVPAPTKAPRKRQARQGDVEEEEEVT